MAQQLAPPPLQTPLIELPPTQPGDPLHRLSGLITRTWNQYFQSFASRIDTAPRTLRGVKIPPSTAAIGATPLPIGTTADGSYRISWYLTVTQAASTSSSVGFVFQHTFRGTTKTQTPPALATNLTSDAASGVIVCGSDAAAPITYAITYSSSGATAMAYAAALVIEQID